MNRADLVKKLENVGRALATNDLVPVMKCFLFDGKRVIANNDAMAIITPCETDAAFAVNGKVLLSLLSTCQSEEVDFYIEGYEVVGRSGRRTFKLPFSAVEDFIFEEPKVEEFDMSIHMDGLEACLLTSAKDSTKTAFMGVLLNGSLYSSDGDSITRYKLGQLKPENQLQPYMMPNIFCETVLKLAEDKVGLVLLTPGWTPGEKGNWGQWAYAKIGYDGPSQDIHYEVWGRLIEPPSIDFESEIKKTIKVNDLDQLPWSKIPEGLNLALQGARGVADAESKPTELLVNGSGKLNLTTISTSGELKDVLVLGKHPEVTALVSAELMQRSIGLTKEMAILSNCCCFREDKLFVLLSNFG